jgi:methylmalonyl-CoA/ethylmalonyl-CoA epimerase
MRPVKSLHHVGIAVRSIDNHRPFYEQVLGAEFEDEQELPDWQLRVCFLRVGDVRLELIQPTDAASRVQAFLDKRGEGLHHLAFAVDDIEARITELKASGIRMVDDVARPGAHQMHVAFIHPQSCGGVLMELCESQTSDGRAPSERS